MDETFGAFIFGIMVTCVFFLFFWHAAEANCQELWDVYDCELARSPFLPVNPQ